MSGVGHLEVWVHLVVVIYLVVVGRLDGAHLIGTYLVGVHLVGVVVIIVLVGVGIYLVCKWVVVVDMRTIS